MDKDIEHKSEITDKKQELATFLWSTKFTGGFYDIDYKECKNIILDSIRISTINKNNKTKLIPFDIKIGRKGSCRIVPSLTADEY